jgi:aminoglycoside phosphotransferase (APT) family kinase protein
MDVPRGIAPETLDPWLAEALPGSQPPFAYQLIAAGGSNLTYRVTDAAGAAWALRRPPVGHTLPTAHDMGREWRIMSALAGTRVPVPECIARSTEPGVLDTGFYVMSFVEGLILRDVAGAEGFTPERAAVATDDLIDVQLAFHTVDLDAIGLADLGRHDDYVGRQLKRWRSQVERDQVREVPLFAELHDRLVAARPPERYAAGLAHGDYRFDNTVLGPDDRIVAVLDWELCTIGDPLADFAWSLQYWADPGDEFTWLTDPPTVHPAFPRRDEVAARYAARSGFDLSDLPYYTVFSWWKQACICEGAYARRLRGATGGMGATGDAEGVARRVDLLLEQANELARGVC